MTKQREDDATPPPAQGGQNLSAQVVAAVEREPGDLVKCTWVGGNNYRCNWWAARPTGGYDNPAIRGQTYGTHVVRQSRFLHVTPTAGGLSIRDAGVAARG
ncbi:MAG TPA: hypothetical protein VF796_11790 [Humisphaera sp.]